jgi:hypothetical protein
MLMYAWYANSTLYNRARYRSVWSMDLCNFSTQVLLPCASGDTSSSHDAYHQLLFNSFLDISWRRDTYTLSFSLSNPTPIMR